MRILRRVVLPWFLVTVLAYALWQGPNWDQASQELQTLGFFLYWYQLPGLIIHGPHGGFGDWRDPAIIVPITTLFYSGCTLGLGLVWGTFKRALRRKDAA